MRRSAEFRPPFHILFHSSPDLTHAWSEDGLSWSWNKTVMGPAELRPLGGGDNERPRVLLDDDGDLDQLVAVASQRFKVSQAADGLW